MAFHTVSAMFRISAQAVSQSPWMTASTVRISPSITVRTVEITVLITVHAALNTAWISALCVWIKSATPCRIGTTVDWISSRARLTIRPICSHAPASQAWISAPCVWINVPTAPRIDETMLEIACTTPVTIVWICPHAIVSHVITCPLCVCTYVAKPSRNPRTCTISAPTVSLIPPQFSSQAVRTSATAATSAANTTSTGAAADMIPTIAGITMLATTPPSTIRTSFHEMNWVTSSNTGPSVSPIHPSTCCP